MNAFKIIVMISFISIIQVYADSLDTFTEMLNCHKMIDLKNRKKNEKFETCLAPFIHFKESKFVKEQIYLTFLQMEKINNPESCKDDIKKMIQSAYDKNTKSICFTAVVDSKEKTSFAVFRKSDHEKARNKWKVIRIKYH